MWFGFHTTEIIEEVPVFKVNFYMMGLDEIDEGITVRITKNLDYLNEEFEGKVKFQLNELHLDPNQAYIPDLHKDHTSRNHDRVLELIDPIESKGGINVYLFDTYSTNDGTSAMLGFTPVLSAQHRKYARMSPQFDRLFISYAGLSDMSTIVHEMGHFLGLSHPWEMSEIDLDLMGLLNDDADHNHMTYSHEVTHFTDEQLDRMQHFALNFRQYLLARIEHKMITDHAYVRFNPDLGNE